MIARGDDAGMGRISLETTRDSKSRNKEQLFLTADLLMCGGFQPPTY